MGTNDRCPCGSGRKVKHCCGASKAPWWRRVQRGLFAIPRAVRTNLALASAKWTVRDVEHDLAHARMQRAYYAERHLFWEREVKQLLAQCDVANNRLVALCRKEPEP